MINIVALIIVILFSGFLALLFGADPKWFVLFGVGIFILANSIPGPPDPYN